MDPVRLVLQELPVTLAPPSRRGFFRHHARLDAASEHGVDAPLRNLHRSILSLEAVHDSSPQNAKLGRTGLSAAAYVKPTGRTSIAISKAAPIEKRAAQKVGKGSGGLVGVGQGTFSNLSR